MYFEILAAAVTDKLWREICEQAIEDACGGNAVARKWISEYLMGRPGLRDAASETATGSMTTEEILAFVEEREGCL